LEKINKLKNQNTAMRRVIVRPTSYTAAFAKSSPRRTLALISVGLTALTVARIVVLLVEAYSSVAAERSADDVLISLCDSGSGADSADFRTLCLKKRSERAAPVFLKAILRAVSSSFSDFCELFSSTGRIAMLVLFCLTGVTAPIAKALAAIFIRNLKQRRARSQSYATSDSDNDDDSDNEHQTGFQVVEIGQQNRHRYNTRQRLQLSLKRSLRSAAERCGIEPLDLGILVKED
tara:strand:- start:948 stop:1649 length:702 start_codon:yes stop_codon:yes gene_type:complete